MKHVVPLHSYLYSERHAVKLQWEIAKDTDPGTRLCHHLNTNFF